MRVSTAKAEDESQLQSLPLLASPPRLELGESQLTRLSDLTLEVAIKDGDLLEYNSILLGRFMKFVHGLSANSIEESAGSAIGVGAITGVVSCSEPALAQERSILQVRYDLRQARERLVLKSGVGRGVACQEGGC